MHILRNRACEMFAVHTYSLNQFSVDCLTRPYGRVQFDRTPRVQVRHREGLAAVVGLLASMAWDRQVHHYRGSIRRKRYFWMLISLIPTRTTIESNMSRATLCSMALSRLSEATGEDDPLSVAARDIAASGFTRTFSLMTPRCCLELFRFEKTHFDRVVSAVGWPKNKLKTTRAGYSVNPLLATCVILSRLASTSRKADVEFLFVNSGRGLRTFWRRAVHFLQVIFRKI